MTTTNPISTVDTPLILVADDDRSIRTLLKVAMEEEGYRVITAKDGEDYSLERLEKALLGLESVPQTSFQQGKVIFIEDVSQLDFPEVAIAPFQDDQIQSLIIMPIVSQKSLWGCLGVLFVPSPQIWESWEKDAWQHLSYLLAIAVRE